MLKEFDRKGKPAWDDAVFLVLPIQTYQSSIYTFDYDWN